MATADALRTFIPGERGAVTAIAPFALVPFSEQLIDGGTPRVVLVHDAMLRAPSPRARG